MTTIFRTKTPERLQLTVADLSPGDWFRPADANGDTGGLPVLVLLPDNEAANSSYNRAAHRLPFGGIPGKILRCVPNDMRVIRYDAVVELTEETK